MWIHDELIHNMRISNPVLAHGANVVQCYYCQQPMYTKALDATTGIEIQVKPYEENRYFCTPRCIIDYEESKDFMKIIRSVVS